MMNDILPRRIVICRIASCAVFVCLLICPFQGRGQTTKSSCAIEPPNAQPPAAIVLNNVTVIDGTGAAPKSAMTLVIKDGRIADLGPTNQTKTPRGAKVIDGTGQFLIPGLWDMHVHLNKANAAALPLLLANGVTSIRDMGGNLEEVKALRQASLEGKIIAPRIKLSGPMLESPQTMQRAKASEKTENWDAHRIAIEKPEDAEIVVKQLVEAGADYIKLRSYATPETYFAIAKACKDFGVQLVGHAPTENIDIIKVLDAGQASFEHAFYPYPLDKRAPEEREKIIAAFVRNKAAIVPTLVAWMPRTIDYARVKAIVEDASNTLDARRQYLARELLSYWVEVVKFDRKPDTAENLAEWSKAIDSAAQDVGVMYRKGVRIMPGTDVAVALVYPGFSLHDELALFVSKIGLTPMQAIESATRVPAEFMGLQSCLGTIEKGKIADLVLLSANPLADIHHTRKIGGVFRGGRYFNQAALARILQKLKENR